MRSLHTCVWRSSYSSTLGDRDRYDLTAYRNALTMCEQCGGRRYERLSGENGAASLQLGGGLVSWIAPGTPRKHQGYAMYVTRLNSHASRWHGDAQRCFAPKARRPKMRLTDMRSSTRAPRSTPQTGREKWGRRR